MNPKLLIVDDDEEIRTQMKWALARDYEVLLADDRAGAVESFRANLPAVVLLDLGLPPHPANPEEGLAALTDLLAINSQAKIIIVTGQGGKRNRPPGNRSGGLRFVGQAYRCRRVAAFAKAVFLCGSARTRISGNAAAVAG